MALIAAPGRSFPSIMTGGFISTRVKEIAPGGVIMVMCGDVRSKPARLAPARHRRRRKNGPGRASLDFRRQRARAKSERRDGELAILYDRQDRFLAAGLYDAESPIRVRILHAGKPERIDDAWLEARLAAAVARRKTMFDNQTMGWRCVNGESDGLPGLVADRYDDTVVLKLYTAAWLPRLAQWTAALVQAVPGCRRVVLRLSRNIQPQAEEKFGVRDGQTLLGSEPDGPVIFLENGLRFEADVLRGQKTGFFLDQRDNRLAVRQLAAGREVLNLFSFSGGFSVAAAAGGARRAVSLDISEHALASARRNFALNGADPAVSACAHQTIRADAFEWLQEAPRELFDLIVIDPPSLARRESERGEALAAYGKLIGAALRRLRPGGILTACSCSAHVSTEEFFGVARDAARTSAGETEELQTTGHAPDHAVTFREGQYLKAIYLAVKS